MAPSTTLTVAPAAYGTASQQCYDLADAIGAAFDPLYQALCETAGMAGNYNQVRPWVTGYDDHVGQFVTMATTLANAVQNMGDLLAFAGYNYALTEYRNTGSPSGPPPAQPAVTSPRYGAECPVLQPGSALGQPGNGLNTNIPGLLAHIGQPVPNGDTTMLEHAADAWHTFAGNGTVTTAAGTLTNISTTLTTALQAPDLDHFADHFRTLAGGAGDLHSAATGLAPLVTAHSDQLGTLRTNVFADTNGLTVKLEQIAAAAAAAIIVTTIFSFGLGLAGADEVEAGAGAAAGVAAISEVGATISAEISAFVGSVLSSAAAAFGGVTALSATALATIAGLGVLSLSGDAGPTGSQVANASTKPPADAYNPNGAKAPGRPGKAEGFDPPAGGDRWVPAPNGRGYGWEDADGRVWVPTGHGPTAHGGPHWDVQNKNGKGYENVYPGGKTR